MSPNDDFRRELNNVFDEVSGTPSPVLKDRVRSAVAEAPEARGPYMIAAVAAVVLTTLIVGLLYVANPFRQPTGLLHPGPTASPSLSPSPQLSPQPSPGTSPVPTPTQSTLPPFVCSAETLQPTHPTHAPTAYISKLATGSHQGEGYDRLVVTFGNGMPAAGVELIPQSSTSFDGAPSGQPTRVKGTSGVKVVIRGADMHSSYSGKLDYVTGYSTLVEVRQIEDFEGVVQLAVGVNGAPCYRAFYLSGPDRLVIDVKAG